MPNWKTIIAGAAIFSTLIGGVWGLDYRIKQITSEQIEINLNARLAQIEEKLDNISADFQQVKNRLFRGR